MTPAAAVATVHVVRRFPWLRVTALVVLSLWAAYTYFVLPVLNKIDRVTPWEGVVPGSCGAPAPVRPVGWTGLLNDAGKALHSLAEGPPSPPQMVGWFRTAGQEARTGWVAFSAGTQGQVLLPNAPLPLANPQAVQTDGRLTDQQVAVIATSVGWPAAEVPNVVARVRAESGGNPRARDYADGTHHGLLQLGTAEQARYLDPGASAFDPRANLTGALRLWQARGWQPWAASDSAVAAQPVRGYQSPVNGCEPTDPGVMQASYGSSGPVVEQAIAFALAQRGKPYLWGATPMAEGGPVPSSFDCSSLIDSAFLAAGVDLPGRATTRTLIDMGTPVVGEPQRGDLVFARADLGHVGLALGGGMMIHAPRTGDVVKVSPIRASYAVRRLDVGRTA